MSCMVKFFKHLVLSAEVVASAIVDKYIGESARIIREMFGYAKEHQPCIIFMDPRRWLICPFVFLFKSLSKELSTKYGKVWEDVSGF